jgi:8-amino-7-oxononanoate synthase
MTPLDDYRAHLERSLLALAVAGLRRRLREPHGIDLVSNDYLGFATHPYLVERMQAALENGPAGSGGSRLLRGHAVYEQVEARLAALSGSEAALLFGTGYAANGGLLQALLCDETDLVLSDALNHASLVDGIRLGRAQKCVFPHQDLSAVEAALRRPHSGRAFVVTESVFSMDGDLTPLADLAALAEEHGALLIVDEAHATGLYGVRGSGRVEELGLRERVLATVHTGGKALGSAGAWVAGSSLLRELLVNRARPLVYSTAPLPVLAAALQAGLDLLDREPARRGEVHRKAALLRAALREQGAPFGGASPIVPIVVGAIETARALHDGVMAAGFDARAVLPPTVPDGTARLRVTARYAVADDDLARFAREVGRLLHTRAA